MKTKRLYGSNPRLEHRPEPRRSPITPAGIICCLCGGDPQPLENFPGPRGVPGSTCRTCLNKAAAKKRAEKKKDFLAFGF